MLAVVGLELMPEALNAQPPWVPNLAFVIGGAFFIGIEWLIELVQGQLPSGKDTAGPLAIFSGVSPDLFSDGVMIGAATVLNPGLGLLLALGQVPADTPEGLAAVATLRRANIRRRARILMALNFSIPILLGAAIDYFALRGAPEIITLPVLALTGGALTSVVVQKMIGEGHEDETSRLGPPLPHRWLRAFRRNLGLPRLLTTRQRRNQPVINHPTGPPSEPAINRHF